MNDILNEIDRRLKIDQLGCEQPIPNERIPWKIILEQLNEGDSFQFCEKDKHRILSVRSSISNAAKILNYRVRTRSTDEGIRVWIIRKG